MPAATHHAKKSTHQDDVVDKNPTGSVSIIIKKKKE
jgi:hypothetical protein